MRLSAKVQDLVAACKQPEPVYVVRPSLPELGKYQQHLREIWDRRWLTNDGPCHIEFEQRLAAYLGVEYLSLVSSGTMALLLMLHASRILSGEVITTPFTFPATTHVLHWNGVRPVFCDVDERTGNIDPNHLEELITPETRALLGVHVYGTPCDVDRIQAIADTHGLAVLYDAAHTFGVRLREQALCAYGEMAALSFHATKLFSTCEGGAIVCSTAAQKERINYLKNFGIADEETVIGPGINGKMNELSAAYGLCQLETVDQEIESRRRVAEAYDHTLSGISGVCLLARPKQTTFNYAYQPILITEDYGISRDDVHTVLTACNILSRKYFFPLTSTYSCYRSLPSAAPGRLPVAERLASQVLCLPMYADLPLSVPEAIGALLRELPTSWPA